MTANLAPADLRELQRAIAHAAVDRLLAEQLSMPEAKSMNDQQISEGLTNRDPATHSPKPQNTLRAAPGAVSRLLTGVQF